MFGLLLLCIFVVGSKSVVQHPQAFEEYDDAHCVCVPNNMCRDNDENNNHELLDIRFADDSCSNYFEVCCKKPVNQTSSPKLIPACGYQSIMSVRITNDRGETRFGEAPWTLVITKKDKANRREVYKCGASLIHPQVALTAAHCVAKNHANEIAVRAGEWNLKSKQEPLGFQKTSVQEIVVHPNFDTGSLKNDIALLILDKPFDLAENVGVICLPQSKILSKTCVATGWGKDSFEEGHYSNVLRKVELPLVSHENCEQALRTTRLGRFFNLHHSFICAGGKKKRDTCVGDGGSPLVCAIPGSNDRYVQMGIVSWGIGCGNTNIPGVYVNVALYTKWIDTQITSRNFDTGYYKYLNST